MTSQFNSNKKEKYGGQQLSKENNSTHLDFIKIKNKLLFKPRNRKQLELMNIIDEKEITFAFGPAGTGKAQPLSSKVKTLNGFKFMKDIEIDDEIEDGFGKICFVRNIYPQGIQDVYEIKFEDERTVYATLDHLWLIKKDNLSSVNTTKEIIDFLDKKQKVYVPLYKPIKTRIDYSKNNQHFEKNYFYGSIFLNTKKINDEKYLISFSNFSEKQFAFLTKCIYTYNLNFINNKKSEYSFILTEKQTNKNKDLFNFVKKSKMDLFQSYLNLNYYERLFFTQGIVDSNAIYNSNKNCFIIKTESTHQVLFLQKLFWSLGCYSKEGNKPHTLEIYCNNLSELSCFKSFNILKTEKKGFLKIKSIKFDRRETCQCIEVSSLNKTYVTDNYIVTHNTHVGAYKAIESLVKGKCEKVILIRPAVEAGGEQIGFLPGTAKKKLEEYLYPIYSLWSDYLTMDEILDLERLGLIEIWPVSFIRGRNMKDAFVLVDEAQNLGYHNFKAVVTRYSENSKMFIAGSLEQIDIRDKDQVKPLTKLIKSLSDSKDFGFMKFTNDDVVRHPLVSKFNQICEKIEKNI